MSRALALAASAWSSPRWRRCRSPRACRKYYLLLAFDALLFGAVAMSLDLLMGYTGLVSFGHAAFFGLGAYSTAVLLERGILSLWAVPRRSRVVVVGALRVRRGLLRDRPARDLLRAPHADLRRGRLHRSSAIRRPSAGSDGIQGAARRRAPARRRHRHADPELLRWSSLYLLLAYVVCRVLVRSHFGRVLVAIRENEDRARFLGYDVQRYKMGVCMISALLTGLGGRPLRGALGLRHARPHARGRISGEFIIMVMIGGLGTLVGPIIGGAFFIAAPGEGLVVRGVVLHRDRARARS